MKKFFFRLFLLGSLLFVIFLSLSTIMPLEKPSAGKKPTRFSNYRALKHVKQISQKPHYTGSENHVQVRNYIVDELQKLDLEVYSQSGYVINATRNFTFAENIITKIPGSDPQPGGDLLLMAHYDSAPHSSLGASDDAAAIAAILESMRALKEREFSPKNNVYILISDAEEIGLLGAQLFADRHPEAENIGLVLNFEARGSSGPSSAILETNYGNEKLIKSFARARPNFPMTSSLMYEVYKIMPNDTDATVFREDLGIPSFFFAFIDGHYNYHTARDNYENADPNSLAHQGAYLMDLVPYYAQADLTNFKSDSDQVYFNFPLFKLIHYSHTWILPLLILAVLGFVGILFYGFKKEVLDLKSILKGFLTFALAVLIVLGIGLWGWKITLKLYPNYTEIQQGFPYNGHYYITSFVLLSIGLILFLYYFFFRKVNFVNAAVAPLLVWLLLNAVLAFSFKGASYFVVSLLLMEAAVGLILWKNKISSWILLLFCIPCIFIFSPLIVYIPVALGMEWISGGLVLLLLVTGLLLPVGREFIVQKRWATLFLLGGIFFFVKAHTLSDFTKNRPQPNSLVYYWDAEEQKAYWKTYDAHIDDWVGQKITKKTRIYDKSTVALSKYGSLYTYEEPADFINLPKAEYQLKKDSISADSVAYQLRIIPQRKVNRLIAYNLQPGLTYANLKFNGVKAKNAKTGKSKMVKGSSRDLILDYYRVHPDTLTVNFELAKDDKAVWEIYEASYDLLDNPWFRLTPRDSTMMPRPFVLNDALIGKQQLQIE